MRPKSQTEVAGVGGPALGLGCPVPLHEAAWGPSWCGRSHDDAGLASCTPHPSTPVAPALVCSFILLGLKNYSCLIFLGIRASEPSLCTRRPGEPQKAKSAFPSPA